VLPKSVLDALSMSGWNALGVYELVARELRKEARESKKQPNAKLSGGGSKW